jgi:hypothetical protein
MQAKGIPDNDSEARAIVQQTATINDHSPIPGHWPHSQIVGLAQIVETLLKRVDELEQRLDEKPRRGRPPKDRAVDAVVEQIHAEAA